MCSAVLTVRLNDSKTNKQGQGKLIFPQPQTMTLSLPLSLFLSLTLANRARPGPRTRCFAAGKVAFNTLFPKIKTIRGLKLGTGV